MNRGHPYHRVVSCQLPDGLTFTARSHKRAPKLRCVLRSDISFACQVALRQPLNGYGVRRAPFLIKPLASPPLGDIRQWYRYLFPSAAAALLSNLSKNALPECSAGVSRAVNKVFTAQCERFSCGKKAVNFEYMSIRFRNTNWLLLERHLREMKCFFQISTHRSVSPHARKTRCDACGAPPAALIVIYRPQSVLSSVSSLDTSLSVQQMHGIGLCTRYLSIFLSVRVAYWAIRFAQGES